MIYRQTSKRQKNILIGFDDDDDDKDFAVFTYINLHVTNNLGLMNKFVTKLNHNK